MRRTKAHRLLKTAFSSACVLLALRADLAAAAPSVTTAPRPNVLFIVSDDLRDATAFSGRNVVPLPNLERLAARGVRFDRAFAQYPVCGPSRASLLTGLRPTTSGIIDNNTKVRSKLPDTVTLPQLFRQNGYFTASLGKVFHGANPKQSADSASWDMDLHGSHFPATETGARGPGGSMHKEIKWASWRAADGDDFDLTDGQIAREAGRLLREHRQQPFFIAVGFQKPHDPYIAPHAYFDRLPLKDVHVHQDPADHSPTLQHSIPQGPLLNAFTEMDTATRRDFTRAYNACVTYVDAQLGRLLDVADELDLWRDTIIIFTADHGFHLGERGWWNKVTLFECGIRVPLIISVPDAVASRGHRLVTPVELLDLYPTLTELAQLPAPHALEGTSLAPLLNDSSAPGKGYALSYVARGGVGTTNFVQGTSLRTPRFRYTEWKRGGPGAEPYGVELYDHETDPGEWRNLAENPAFASTRAQLSARLAELGASSARPKNP